MKTVSVIGPGSRRTARLAEKLGAAVPAGVRVVEGAGPENRPDVVVAAVGEPTGADIDVVRAVAQAMGVVVLFFDAPTAPWPAFPGQVQCHSVEDVCAWVERLCVNMAEWKSDAFRADAERADRVRIAVRLAAGRISRDLVGEVARDGDTRGGRTRDRDTRGRDAQAGLLANLCGGLLASLRGCPRGTAQGAAQGAGQRTGDGAGWEGVHAQFVAQLRLAVLSQGVPMPTIDASTPPRPPRPPWPWVQILAAAAASVACAAGVATASLRVLSLPVAVFVGLVLGCVVFGARLYMVRSARMIAQRNGEAAVLREAWNVLVTGVISRLSIPAVADRLALPSPTRSAVGARSRVPDGGRSASSGRSADSGRSTHESSAGRGEYTPRGEGVPA